MVPTVDAALTHQERHVLATIDLPNCPYRGRVFDQLETDLWVEDRFFAGWRNLLINSIPHRPSGTDYASAIVVDDAGAPAMEWSAYKPIFLIAGDLTWHDVDLASTCRVLNVKGFPYGTYDESCYDFQGRTGFVFRTQDARRHYFAGFQDGRMLVIAVREDSSWIVLNHVDFCVDLRRYYAMELCCRGPRIDLFVDGEHYLGVSDGRWAGGPGGLYSNTMARWRDATIRCTPAEAAAIVQRRQEGTDRLKAIRSRVPQAIVAREVPVPDSTGLPLRAGSVVPSEPETILIEYEQDGRVGLLCMTPEGERVWKRLLWDRGFALVDRPDRPYAVHDVDLDGKPEIVMANRQEILVLSATDGEEHARAPVPDACPFLSLRHQKARLARNAKVWHLDGPQRPASIVFFQTGGCGGHTIWCYDHRLKLRWVHHNAAGRYGHDITGYDVDGDGRTEVVAAYYALDADGHVLWRVRDQDLITWKGHADRVVAGHFDADPNAAPLVVAVAGSEGIYFIDGPTGRIVHEYRDIGHVQHVVAGNFCHGRAGRELWTVTDWGACGIHQVFDARAELLWRGQLDPRVIWLTAIRWWQDRDLLLMTETPETFGLWDGYGRRVVDLSAFDGIPPSLQPTRTGLPPTLPFVRFRFAGNEADRIAAAADGKLFLFGAEA